MIKKVTALNSSYQYVFDMSALEGSGALIYDIAGIAEHSREITVDKLSDRTVISGIAPKQRIITMSIRIVAVDVESERRTLRRILAEGQTVTLSFETDLVPLGEIQGVVESCNNPIFTKESVMTVTIICPDSNFLAEAVTTPIVEAEEDIVNTGDVPSGCCTTITLDGSVNTGTGTVTNVTTAAQIAFDLAKVSQLVGGIQLGDILKIDSGSKKQCILTRGGTSYNVFSAIIFPYSWIKIVPGTNAVSVSGFAGATVLEYQPAYGGL